MNTGFNIGYLFRRRTTRNTQDGLVGDGRHVAYQSTPTGQLGDLEYLRSPYIVNHIRHESVLDRPEYSPSGSTISCGGILYTRATFIG